MNVCVIMSCEGSAPRPGCIVSRFSRFYFCSPLRDSSVRRISVAYRNIALGHAYRKKHRYMREEPKGKLLDCTGAIQYSLETISAIEDNQDILPKDEDPCIIHDSVTYSCQSVSGGISSALYRVCIYCCMLGISICFIHIGTVILFLLFWQLSNDRGNAKI